MMFRYWWPAFAASKYTREELSRVLPGIFARPPQWPREHLPAVNRAVTELRESRQPRKPEFRADNPNRCRWCEWLCLVVVPHPLDVQGDKWVEPRRTGSVFCTHCTPGQRSYESACGVAHAKKDGKAPMTLEQYERTVTGNWRELMVAAEESDSTMRKAEAATEALGPSATVPKNAPRKLIGMVADSFSVE